MKHEEALVDNFLRTLRQAFLPAFLIAVVGAGVTFVFSTRLPARYTSEAVILVAPNYTDLNLAIASLAPAPPINVHAYREAALSESVTLGVMKAMGSLSVGAAQLDAFRRNVTIEVVDSHTSGLIRVAYTSDSPEGALKGAHLWAGALLEWDERRAQSNLDAAIGSLTEQIRSIDSQIVILGSNPDVSRQRLDSLLGLRTLKQEHLVGAQAARQHHIPVLQQVSPASLPSAPSFPDPLLFTGLAFVLIMAVVYGGYLVSYEPKSGVAAREVGS